MLDIKKEPKIEKLEKRKTLNVADAEDLKKRSKSRSPSRQLPTSTTEELAKKANTPPPPPSIREDYKKIKPSALEDPEKKHKKQKKSSKSDRSEEKGKSLEKVKKPFKIPKKRNFRKRTPSPPSLDQVKTPPKKSRINEPINNPNMEELGGWAKVKESHPDEFRPHAPMGPFQDQHIQHVQQRFFSPHRHFGNNRRGQGPHQPPNPWRNGPQMRGPGPNFHPGPRPHPNQQWAENYDVMQEAMRTNPEYFMDQVIPAIIREGQMQLQQGRINPDQFSELMRQVDMMRAQGMDQLENRPGIQNMHHNMQQNPHHDGPWQFNRGPMPGPDPTPFQHEHQQMEIHQLQIEQPPVEPPHKNKRYKNFCSMKSCFNAIFFMIF